MKEKIEQLLEDYQRRIVTMNQMLFLAEELEDNDEIVNRLKTKAGLYRTIAAELKGILNKIEEEERKEKELPMKADLTVQLPTITLPKDVRAFLLEICNVNRKVHRDKANELLQKYK